MNAFEARVFERAAATVADLGAIARSVGSLRRMKVEDGYHLEKRPEPLRRRVRRDYRPPASKRTS
jgi:phage gpG-like protein